MNWFSLTFVLIVFPFVMKGQMCDTIIPFSIKKELMTPDSIDQPDSLYTFKWNNQFAYWERNEKHTYSYNNSHSLAIEEKSKWDANEWLLYDLKEYVYDDNKLSTKTNSWWDFYYEEWIYKQQENYSYDNISRLVDLLKTKWSESSLQWKNDSLIRYDYNDSDLPNNIYYDTWSVYFEDWEENLKLNINYDSLGNIKNKIKYMWEYDLLIWESKEKHTFQYDNISNMTEQTHFITDGLFDWINNWKIEYAYYENDYLETETHYTWFENESWFEDYKFNYTYDDQNRIIIKTGLTFDWDQLIWENHFLTKYEYLDDQLINKVIFFTWDTQNSQWRNFEKYHYYYPGFTNVSGAENNFEVIVYPNPANEKIYIEFNDFQNAELNIVLYDVLGKEIERKQIKNQGKLIEFETQNFLPGIYFLNTNYGNKSIIQRILITDH